MSAQNRVMRVLAEPLEKRLLLASVSATAVEQSAAITVNVLTATFKKNAPSTASSTSFSRLGKYATHAVSGDSDFLSGFASKAGESAKSLYKKGVRETWWMGQRTQTIAGNWIVRFDDFSGSARKQLAAARQLVAKYVSADVTVDRYTYLDGAFLIKAPQTFSYQTLATQFSAIEGFKYIEPDFALAAPQAIPNDTSYATQWGWAKINAPGAWDVTTGSSQVVVAVLDTGTQIAHPDLAANIFVNPGEIAGNGVDDDNNGFIDDSRGWNFGNGTATVDNGSHGTHVAGTIGAVGNNGTGVTGMSWNVRVLPLDIFPDNYTSSTYYIAAMGYLNSLKQRGINVVASNNSYGSLGSTSQSVKDAIKVNAQHNIMFVAAAGNDGQNVTSGGFGPGTNGEPNSIAVAASTSTDSRAGFSNWGTNVDIAAPGNSIYSTTPTNSYGNSSGTSMASPHVAGLVGLAYSVVPNASYHQIKKAILDGGDAVNWASSPTATNKRINAANTINLVRTYASGKLFLDSNRDGVQQGNESNLSGWVVYNDANNNSIRDTSETYANIQLNGQYDLILTPGAQLLRLDMKGGYSATLGGAGYAFTLNQYDSSAGKDFAVAASTTGSVGGIVFADTNGNGTREGGELTLGGTAVYLDRNNNGVLDAPGVFVSADVPRPIADYGTATSGLVVARSGTISDVNVTVNISHNTLNNLRVTLIHPDGTRVRLADANGGSGDNFVNTVFDTQAATAVSSGSAPFTGSFRPVDSLSGLNGKSIAGGWRLEVVDRNSTDPGTIDGWSIQFNNEIGDSVQFTSADGSYRYTNLPAGTHQVRVVPRSGFNIISPAGGLHARTLLAGQVEENNDFALQPIAAFNPASISGQFWYDGNANAVKNTDDFALAGWTAYIDSNGNDQLDSGEITSITDSAGNYRFDGLLAGTYTIRAAALPGYGSSLPGAGEYSVTVVSGQNASGGDFAYFQRAISGMVFIDYDADGVKDSADSVGLTGWTVYIDSNNNSVLDAGEPSVLARVGGTYGFNGLDAGTHIVRVVASGSYTISQPAAGFRSVNLSSAISATGQNFGFWQPAFLYGSAYVDSNLNAIYDTGESYLNGWTVYLDANNNSILDSGETTSTVSGGFYQFSGLKPGLYRARLVMQAPYIGVTTLQAPTLTSGQYLSGQNMRVIHPSMLNYRDADYPSSPRTGWDWAYYEFGGNLTSVTALDSFTPVRTGTTATTGSTPVVNINTPTPRSDNFGIIWTGYVYAPSDTLYTFYTNSDDGSTLSIGDQVVVDNDTAHTAQEQSGSIALRQGLHEVTIRYFENSSSQSITASWESPTITKTQIPSSAAFLAPPIDVDSPTVSITPVAPSNRTTPVDSVQVVFSELVTGFDLADLSMTRNGQAIVLSGVSISTADNITYTINGLTALTKQAGVYILTLTASGSGIVDQASNALVNGDTENWYTFSTVAGRHLFYNNSAYDGNSAVANAADDAAIAPDKVALISGKASFANYSSFSRGLNGVMVDIANPGGTITANDFIFKVSTPRQSGGFTVLETAPTITIRPGAGANGSDRVTLIWPDRTIVKQWLEVTVLNTVATGLQSQDKFYFGNAIGETGDSLVNSYVTAIDMSRVVASYSGFSLVDIYNLFDINRDRRVNVLDMSAVVASYTGFDSLVLITV